MASIVFNWRHLAVQLPLRDKFIEILWKISRDWLTRFRGCLLFGLNVLLEIDAE
jgi:hypothetical protein